MLVDAAQTYTVNGVISGTLTLCSNANFSSDGTKNGLEYFMNSAAGFTASPAPSGCLWG